MKRKDVTPGYVENKLIINVERGETEGLRFLKKGQATLWMAKITRSSRNVPRYQSLQKATLCI